MKTHEEYLEIIKKDGEALYHVPENLRTPELCLEAVKQNGCFEEMSLEEKNQMLVLKSED